MNLHGWTLLLFSSSWRVVRDRAVDVSRSAAKRGGVIILTERLNIR